MLGSSTHPLEVTGKKLVNGTDAPLWDVAPPPPVRPHGLPSAPAVDAASVFNYLTTRVNTDDSLDSHFMAWATRMIQRYLSGDITGGPQLGASLEAGFDWAMQIALARGHRTLAVGSEGSTVCPFGEAGGGNIAGRRPSHSHGQTSRCDVPAAASPQRACAREV